MKILVLASNFKVVAPDCITAPERIASIITEGMVKKGHKVVLAASGDSKTKAELLSIHPKASINDPLIGENRHIDYELMLIKKAIEFANKENFDLINSHFDTRTAIFGSLAKPPMISTLHSPLIPEINNILNNYRDDQSYISISDYQRKGNPNLNYKATIYHGIDTKQFKFYSKNQDHLLIVGRATPKKGFNVAIQIAKKSKRKLKMIGSVRTKANKKYVKTEIKPKVDNKTIFYEENIPYSEINANMGKAKLMLLPIQWEEAFGLVLIEAMASGTPVIAFARGSIPEIILDGKTGFIIDSSPQDKRGNWLIKKTGTEGMVEAVQKIYSMPEDKYRKMRENCRRHIEKKFTIEKMIDSYEKVYQKIIKKKN